jgi:sugar O-acyltransferase (sialic acid O-acetyltransferase NeuD family)
MVIAGARGLARELLEIFSQRNALDNLYFFDNVSAEIPETLFNRFPILRSLEALQDLFKRIGDSSFCLGLGRPVLRHNLYQQFKLAGGSLTSVISQKSEIGQFDVKIFPGCCILPGVVITSGVTMGTGCLVNPNATISHDCILGDFVEISPGANITGNCHIGDFSFVGANSVILPKVKIGKNVVIGAGAVVTKDIPDNSMAVGVPAIVKKSLSPLNLR